MIEQISGCVIPAAQHLAQIPATELGLPCWSRPVGQVGGAGGGLQAPGGREGARGCRAHAADAQKDGHQHRGEAAPEPDRRSGALLGPPARKGVGARCCAPARSAVDTKPEESSACTPSSSTSATWSCGGCTTWRRRSRSTRPSSTSCAPTLRRTTRRRCGPRAPRHHVFRRLLTDCTCGVPEKTRGGRRGAAQGAGPAPQRAARAREEPEEEGDRDGQAGAPLYPKPPPPPTEHCQGARTHPRGPPAPRPHVHHSLRRATNR